MMLGETQSQNSYQNANNSLEFRLVRITVMDESLKWEQFSVSYWEQPHALSFSYNICIPYMLTPLMWVAILSFIIFSQSCECSLTSLTLSLRELSLFICFSYICYFSSISGKDRTSAFFRYSATFNSEIKHIEPDLFIEGNIILSTYSTIGTTNGVNIETIAGYPSILNYHEGIGVLAQFRYIFGFNQISPTQIVAADHGNHCLWLIDQISKWTSTYAGLCGTSGFEQGTSSARFRYPWQVITDVKMSRMLIVSDSNSRLRHVSTLSQHEVTTLFDTYIPSSTRGITQSPLSGDIYLTSNTQVYHLNYTSHVLSLLSGSSRGYSDADIAESLFSTLRDILVIDKGTKLLLADLGNRRLRVLDLITNATKSLCSGGWGLTDGDMISCSLPFPYSLTIINNTLYVARRNFITKIQGKSIAGKLFCKRS